MKLLQGTEYFMTLDEKVVANAFVSTDEGDVVVVGAVDDAAVVFKVDDYGNQLWGKLLSAEGVVLGHDIVQVEGGDFAVLGSISEGDVDHIVVIKLDAAGEVIWNTAIGSGESGQGIAISSGENGLIVLGSIEAPILYKLAIDGDIEWSVRFEGDFFSTSNMRILEDGSAIIAGTKSWDAFAMKLDPQRNVQWAKSFGSIDGAHRIDRGYDIEVLGEDGFLLTGYTTYYYRSWSYDGLLLRLDVNGNLLWARALVEGLNQTDTGDERIHSLHAVEDGGYVVMGTTDSYEGSGRDDILLAKLDADGNAEWARVLGEGPLDDGIAMHVASNGDYVLLGDDGDFFIARFAENGEIADCASDRMHDFELLSEDVLSNIAVSTVAVEAVNLTLNKTRPNLVIQNSVYDIDVKCHANLYATNIIVASVVGAIIGIGVVVGLAVGLVKRKLKVGTVQVMPKGAHVSSDSVSSRSVASSQSVHKGTPRSAGMLCPRGVSHKL